MTARRSHPARLRESQIQSAVIAHWRALGLPETFVAAIPNARSFGQAGLTKGLPDLIVIGGNLRGGQGWIELKTDTGKLRPEQQAFRELCLARGVPHAVTRGLDEPLTVLEGWKIVRPRSLPLRVRT